MSKPDKNVIVGLIIVAIGGLLLLDSFGFINFNFWRMLGKFWPVILIVIGLLIILERDKIKQNSEHSETTPGDTPIGDKSRESTAFGILGDIRLAGFAEVPDTIDKSLLIGDIVIDLSNAKLPEGESRISVSVLIGDIDIILPADFSISADLSCLIGSTSVDRRKSDGLAANVKHEDDHYAGAPARLIIHGRALIGDVSVIHALR
jgi:predicted membrane protein